MPACPGCGAPHPVGAPRCAACHTALPAGRPLPPPSGPPLERELVGAGTGARRSSAATSTQVTRELPRVESRTPPPVHRDDLVELAPWTEDRRGRSPVLPGLIGVAAAVLTILGLVTVFTRDSNDSPEPQPDGPTPTTVVPVPSTVAPTLPPLTTAPAPSPDPAATTPVATVATEPPPATTVAPPATAAPAPATSAAAARPPATAAPAPSPTPAASSPAPVDDVVVDEEATATAQGFADALAAGDWTLARRLNPALAQMSDRELQRGYGDLADSTVVPVRSEDAGRGRVDLRLGLVAHQESAGNRQTTLYCVTWRIDPAAGTIDPVGSAQVVATLAAWVDPGAVAAELRSSC